MARRIRILSIDGGGVRGFIPATLLHLIEKRMRELTGDDQARLAEHFDLVAGTSTGGLIVGLLLVPDQAGDRPRYSSADVLQHHFENAQKIFHLPMRHWVKTAAGLSDEKYPASGLESYLKNVFGDYWLSDLVRPCLISAYDIERRQATFFTQHVARERPEKDFRLFDVGRATTAAPVFFEVANVRSRVGRNYALIDGGVFANNPARCAMTEAEKYFQAEPADISILSIGTGRVRQGYEYERAKDWGSVQWLRPLIDIMISANSEEVDYACRLALNRKSDGYLRIDADLGRLGPSGSDRFDNVSPANIDALCDLAERTFEEWTGALDGFLKSIIEP